MTHSTTGPQRKHPRIALLASVELGSSGEQLILTVKNISVGGMFVLRDGHDLSAFTIGSRHELTVFTPGDMEQQLVVRGQVVRHDPDGMALKWREDDTSGHRLSAVIARARGGGA